MKMQDIPRPLEGEIICTAYAHDFSDEELEESPGPVECFCALGYLAHHLGVIPQQFMLEQWTGPWMFRPLAHRLGVTRNDVWDLMMANDGGTRVGVHRVSPQPLIDFVDAHRYLCWSDEYEPDGQGSSEGAARQGGYEEGGEDGGEG